MCFRLSLPSLLLRVGVSLLLVTGIRPFAPAGAQPLRSDLSSSAVTISSLTNFTYAQNFNTLPNAGILLLSVLANPSPAPALFGLQVARTGAGTDTLSLDDGGTSVGSVYGYRRLSSNDIAFGTLNSDTSGAGDFYYGFRFLNDTGGSIESMTLNYTGELWRSGQPGLSETLSFSSAVFSANTGGLGGLGFSESSALSYTPTSPSATGALNGNLAANRTSLTETIRFTTPVASGQEIWIRWIDRNTLPGSRDFDNGMAIDDLNITFTPTPAPNGATAALVGSVTGLVSWGGTRFRRQRRRRDTERGL
ncbi:MAG: hypothetical protein H7Z41_17435 [Cytophagales bacterium]|nr:hypothetical protein [Armatimonadota bacterium]